MADDETSSGIPALSAFDKLKLSSSNNYIINRNNSCNNNLNVSTRSQIDKNSHSLVSKMTTASGSATAAAATAASEASDVASVAATESSKCEKSISLALAQYAECNNKTIMMFNNNSSSSEVNTTTFGGSSACAKRRVSGFSSFSPSSPTAPTSNTPAKNEKTMQIFCGATDNNGAIAIPHLTPSSSSSLSQSLTSLSSSSSSSLSSLASITMVMPNNVNAPNFDMFSSPPSVSSLSLSSSSSLSMSSPNLSVQNKVKKFDSNEVSIKMLKSGKCKTSVSVSSLSPSSLAATALTNASMMQMKPKSAPIICAPPPMVLANQSNKFGNNSASIKKSNPKVKNQNFGFPMLPGRLATVAVVTKQQSLNMDNKKRQSPGGDEHLNEQDTTDERNKKKRCSDRYDSSESSDSGVATSLSCTDSSTASSDASDPGSPYSPVLLGDDLHHKPNMPPQTILATTNGNATKSPTTGAATPVQNVLKGGKQQQKHQNQSQNKCITPQQQQKQGKVQISSPLLKVSQHLWPWTSLGGVGAGGNFSEMASSPKTNITALNNKTNNKRHSQVSSTPTDGGAKKTRTTNSNTIDGANINGAALQPPQIAPNNKRLKAAAMEESQTKITGYFKSQMKAQIHQSGLKKDTMAHILPSPSMSTSLPSVTVTAVVSSSSSSMSSNSIVSNSTSTSSSLNKYFNLLSSQLRDDQERVSNPPSNLPSLPPALKKIERSKPTKIAQVAPNLRKTTAAPPLSSQVIEKSPKKHVAIAPRTAETRQRHEQSLPSPMKAPAPPSQPQQPVLLTAIRIPQPNQPPQLVPTSQHQQAAVPHVNVTKAQPNGASAAIATKIPTGPSLYQIPMMPNLVQFPNLIAANVSQLAAARGNHHHHHHPTTTAQYFLNGTVFKLQQFTTSPNGANPPTFSIENGNQSMNSATTTASAIEQHTSNTKNTSSITANSLQEMLSNQFQTQQQQQQSVAAHNHRLHHSQPVFMATTTGLLLNAASLPAMLGSNKQTMAMQSQQIPALQPIQGASAMMPGLSSIFSSHQEVATQQLQPYKSEQMTLDAQTPLQQTHLPPLSVSSSAFSKLAIVKAGGAFTPSVHQVSATQPPPLVTISSGSQNVIASTKGNSSKPSVSAKPYQKKNGQQEGAKSKKNTTESAKKALLEPAPPARLPLPNVLPPSTSPPALAYPSLIAHKEEQKRTEDLFDLLKNSKNETTLTPPSTLFQFAEKAKEESFNTICMQPSSPLSSPESTSNTTISDESIKLEESPSFSLSTSSSLECSLASTSLISSDSPMLIIDIKQEETETSVIISETSSTDSIAATLSPIVDTALADGDTLPKSAISPILSQPKTIRFPAKHESGYRFGPKGMRRHDGVCYWDKCNKKHESSSKLLDHMQTHHVNTQTGPFACLWLGCKVYGRESCSRRWLERHVLSHGGTKPFKCIVDGCGFRFGSQLALQKHVNGHFTATESKDSTNKRTSDPPVPKLLRKNGKKLRYRRQPFSARMFDFFDAGIMEGLQHRLRQISTLTNGKNSITFQGEIIMRRRNLKGIVECYVQWAPPKIISNEWLPESGKPYIKTLPINQMQPNEKTNVELLLNSAYRLPHSPNLFQSFHSLSRQNSQDSTTNLYQDHSQSIATTDDTTDETSRSSSIGNPSLSSISNLPLKLPQMELRQKQSRKPPKRIQPS